MFFAKHTRCCERVVSRAVYLGKRPKQHSFLSPSSVRMIDLSIGDKKLFSIMRLLPPRSHFPWAIIAGLSERPVITTGLGHTGKSISAREVRGGLAVCACACVCVTADINDLCLHNHLHVIRYLPRCWNPKLRSSISVWLNVKHMELCSLSAVVCSTGGDMETGHKWNMFCQRKEKKDLLISLICDSGSCFWWTGMTLLLIVIWVTLISTDCTVKSRLSTVTLLTCMVISERMTIQGRKDVLVQKHLELFWFILAGWSITWFLSSLDLFKLPHCSLSGVTFPQFSSSLSSIA